MSHISSSLSLIDSGGVLLFYKQQSYTDLSPHSVCMSTPAQNPLYYFDWEMSITQWFGAGSSFELSVSYRPLVYCQHRSLPIPITNHTPLHSKHAEFRG